MDFFPGTPHKHRTSTVLQHCTAALGEQIGVFVCETDMQAMFDNVMLYKFISTIFSEGLLLSPSLCRNFYATTLRIYENIENTWGSMA